MSGHMIGEALRIVRLYWGKTQQELAQALGVSQSYISEVEKGRREATIDLLGRYSRELKVPMSALMFFAEEIEGAPPMTRGRFIMAGKALDILKRIIPDELDKAG